MKRARHPGSRGRGRRSGLIIIAVLVSLLVASLAIASLSRLVLLRYRSQRQQLRAVQAQLLSQSAHRRAAARLATDHAYAGEIWSLPAGTGGLMDDARVVINVQPADSASTETDAGRALRVTVTYPDDPVHAIRLSRQWRWIPDIPKQPDNPKQPDTAEQPSAEPTTSEDNQT